jgi:hypothetical protein
MNNAARFSTTLCAPPVVRVVQGNHGRRGPFEKRIKKTSAPRNARRSHSALDKHLRPTILNRDANISRPCARQEARRPNGRAVRFECAALVACGCVDSRRLPKPTAYQRRGAVAHHAPLVPPAPPTIRCETAVSTSIGSTAMCNRPAAKWVGSTVPHNYPSLLLTTPPQLRWRTPHGKNPPPTAHSNATANTVRNGRDHGQRLESDVQPPSQVGWIERHPQGYVSPPHHTPTTALATTSREKKSEPHPQRRHRHYGATRP